MDDRADEVEQMFGLYKLAAGEGALCELRLRLLADKVPALEHLAHDRFLENIEKEVIVVFAHCLNAAEIETLTETRRLRNKLLHGDFQAARERLAQLGAPLRAGGVVMFELQKVTGASMLEKVEAIAGGEPGTLVASTSSTAQGTILGWLFELALSGDLHEAVKVFRRTVALIDRLADEADKRQPNRGAK